MVDQENLQEAWAKARTLKAVPDLAAVDPDRVLLSDMLTTLYAVSPHGEFNAERHSASREIFAFLTGQDDPQFYRENSITVTSRDFLLTKLKEIAVDFEKGSRLYGSQQDVAVAMQRRIQHADLDYLQWLGNPVGELPNPEFVYRY
jgi:hypothetical protein